MWNIRENIQRRQSTIVAHISNQAIYELYMGAEIMLVSRRFMRWWDQDVGLEV